MMFLFLWQEFLVVRQYVYIETGAKHQKASVNNFSGRKLYCDTGDIFWQV